MTRLVTVVDMATVWTSPEAPRGVDEPAVRGRVRGADLPLGEDVTVRLVEASIDERRIAFALT